MLRRAESLRRPGPYQLQAAIAAGHAEGAAPEVIAPTYAALEQVDPSPIVRLNRAVAVALAGDVEEGLALIDGIEGLDGYSYLPAARADLLRRLDRRAEAAQSYREALALTDNAPERRFLERRLRDVGGRAAGQRRCEDGVDRLEPGSRHAARLPPEGRRGRRTGRPSRIANAISASVPQLPPTAITASPDAATARFRAWPMPVTTT